MPDEICPNCGHLVKYHDKKTGCAEGDRSWQCGCRDTRFSLKKLSVKEREIYERGYHKGYDRGFQAGVRPHGLPD